MSWLRWPLEHYSITLLIIIILFFLAAISGGDLPLAGGLVGSLLMLLSAISSPIVR